MHAYVNQQAMGDLFRILEHERNAVQKAMLLKTLITELAQQATLHAASVCFDLKKAGWSIGAISSELDISERAVRRLITHYSDKQNVHNPLQREERPPNIVDITSLVSREASDRRRSEQTSHPTIEPR